MSRYEKTIAVSVDELKSLLKDAYLCGAVNHNKMIHRFPRGEWNYDMMDDASDVLQLMAENAIDGLTEQIFN